MKNSNSFNHYLTELHEFQKQADNLHVLEFEKWRNSLLEKLKGNYKNRFSSLQMYTIINETAHEDDVPF